MNFSGIHEPDTYPSREQWEEMKPEIEDMYLRQNMCLKAIVEELAQRGFKATARQYKTRIKAWKFDRKKIRGEIWRAMYIMTELRSKQGLTSVFRVPIRGEDATWVTYERLKKQMKRVTGSGWHDVHKACLIINENKIQIYEGDECNIKLTHQPERPDARFQTFEPIARSLDAESERTSESYDYDYTTLNIVPYPDQDPAASSFPQSYLKAQGTIAGRHWTSVQEFTQFMSDPQVNDIDDERHHSNIQLHEVHAMSEGTPRGLLGEFDLLATLGLFSLDPSCNSSMREVIQDHVLQLAPPQKSRSTHFMTDEKRLAALWIAPYMLESVLQRTGHGRVCERDREDGLNAFRQMLKAANQFIFPFCNSMVTVLASNEQPELLVKFLTECCHIVNEERIGLTYGSPFHFALALHTRNENAINMYATTFPQSSQIIEMIWGKYSPNHIITKVHESWWKLEQKKYEQVQAIMEECLKQSEIRLGYRHLTTVSCLALLSRMFAELNDMTEAIRLLEDAIQRLVNGPELLQSYRYNLLFRLAERQSLVGCVTAAEQNFRAVLDFQLGYFGLRSPLTWGTIETLCDLLKNQGRDTEAYQLHKDMSDGHDHQYSEVYESASQNPDPSRAVIVEAPDET